MNTAHWHLALNHLPIAATYFGVLILGSGFILKNQSVKNTGLILLILAALFAIPTLLTGEGAEDILEAIAQNSDHFIHEHEEIAEKAFWISEFVGILSLITIWFRLKRNRPLNKMMMVILFIGLINSFIMWKAGNTGGLIRHTEIRSLES